MEALALDPRDYEPVPELADGEPSEVQIDLDELVMLCAFDDELFYRSFFPKTFRQGTTSKHLEMDAAMNNPDYRLVNIRAFRGSAKTTRLFRANIAKRIAYGLDRTILYIGASEPHAGRSIQWLRAQLKFNNFFRDTFGLVMGRKDNETEIEVINTKLDIKINVLGAGINASVRGINFDDYRPGRILLDDVITDENGATAEQREKISNLIHGALRNSLAPITEAPNAKMVMAQTPIHKEDASELAFHDAEWLNVEFSCWTEETRDLPLDQQISSWPERFPTVELRKQKRFAAARGKLGAFIREMEVRLTDPDLAAFKSFWLQYRPRGVIPPMMPCIMMVDPVPPPSERQIEKNMHGKDYEAVGVLGREGANYHLLAYEQSRGHEPNWTEATLFAFNQKFRPQYLTMKPVAYERTLVYLLKQAMIRRGVYFQIKTSTNKGLSKYHFITTVITPVASYNHLFIDDSMTDFASQFTQYPQVAHDDLLDMLAVGLEDFVNPYLETDGAGRPLFPDYEHELELQAEGRAP